MDTTGPTELNLCQNNITKFSKSRKRFQYLNEGITNENCSYDVNTNPLSLEDDIKQQSKIVNINNGYSFYNYKDHNEDTYADSPDNMSKIKRNLHNDINGVKKFHTEFMKNRILYKPVEKLIEDVVGQQSHLNTSVPNRNTSSFPSKSRGGVQCNSSFKCIPTISPSNNTDFDYPQKTNSFKELVFPDDLMTKPCEKPSSKTFFNDPCVQEKLFQENLRAKILLNKYFSKDEEDLCPQPLLNNEIENEALTLIRNVSEMLNEYKNFSSSTEIFIGKPKIGVKDNKKFRSFHKPFGYKNTYNINNTSSKDKTKTRDALPTVSLHSSCDGCHFIDTRSLYDEDLFLYKNDSTKLEKDISAEEFSPSMQERLMKKRCSCACVESNSDTFRHSNITQGSGDQPDMNFDDYEYKKWLKYNNWIHYTDMTITESKASSSNGIVDISPSQRFRDDSLYLHTNRIWRQKSKTRSSYNLYSSQFNQVILYEHVVIFTFFHYILDLYYIRRHRRLSLYDRFLQFLFFIMCFYVVVLIDHTGIGNSISNIKFFNKVNK